MCDKNWSNYKSAKSYYKACNYNTIPNYDIKNFKKIMKNIVKDLEKNNIFIIYVGWDGVGTEGQYIFDEAYNIIESNKKYKNIDIFKSFKILYSEDMLYKLSKDGKINLLLDYYFFKSYLEKKEVKLKFEIINEIFQKYFGKKCKINKNSIFIKI